jgi:hypothetical protein
MSVLIWLVYVLLFVCTSAVSVVAVMSRRGANAPPEPAIEDSHSAEEAPPEKPAAKVEPGPLETPKATDAAHEPGAEQKSEDTHTKEGELVTSGWV